MVITAENIDSYIKKAFPKTKLTLQKFIELVTSSKFSKTTYEHPVLFFYAVFLLTEYSYSTSGSSVKSASLLIDFLDDPSFREDVLSVTSLRGPIPALFINDVVLESSLVR